MRSFNVNCSCSSQIRWQNATAQKYSESDTVTKCACTEILNAHLQCQLLMIAIKDKMQRKKTKTLETFKCTLHKRKLRRAQPDTTPTNVTPKAQSVCSQTKRAQMVYRLRWQDGTTRKSCAKDGLPGAGLNLSQDRSRSTI